MRSELHYISVTDSFLTITAVENLILQRPFSASLHAYKINSHLLKLYETPHHIVKYLLQNVKKPEEAHFNILI
jgi:hypothetical protein